MDAKAVHPPSLSTTSLCPMPRSKSKKSVNLSSERHGALIPVTKTKSRGARSRINKRLFKELDAFDVAPMGHHSAVHYFRRLRLYADTSDKQAQDVQEHVLAVATSSSCMINEHAMDQTMDDDMDDAVSHIIASALNL
jgi:hypothetical protein